MHYESTKILMVANEVSVTHGKGAEAAGAEIQCLPIAARKYLPTANAWRMNASDAALAYLLHLQSHGVEVPAKAFELMTTSDSKVASDRHKAPLAPAYGFNFVPPVKGPIVLQTTAAPAPGKNPWASSSGKVVSITRSPLADLESDLDDPEPADGQPSKQKSAAKKETADARGSDAAPIHAGSSVRCDPFACEGLEELPEDLRRHFTSFRRVSSKRADLDLYDRSQMVVTDQTIFVEPRQSPEQAVAAVVAMATAMGWTSVSITECPTEHLKLLEKHLDAAGIAIKPKCEAAECESDAPSMG